MFTHSKYKLEVWKPLAGSCGCCKDLCTKDLLSLQRCPASQRNHCSREAAPPEDCHKRPRCASKHERACLLCHLLLRPPVTAESFTSLSLFKVLSWHLQKGGLARLSVLARGVSEDDKLEFSVTDRKRDTRRQMCQALVVESLGHRKKRLDLRWILVLKKRGNRSKSWKAPACCSAGRERKI